ncbi:MAG: DUF2723 domain-containing protein [Patescibacteria group bacterium]
MKIFAKIITFFFFVFIGYIYLHNLTRDVYGGDIGDLVTSAYFLGVAHPPGYPLFSLVGYFFSHLNIPFPVVSKVALISVVSSMIGLIIYFKFCLKVSRNIFISLLSTSILAFSYLYWLTAELPEGLALNNLFVIVILLLAIKFAENKNTKDLYWLFLFIGLSLTHQLFIITLFPAIFLLIIKHAKYFFSKKRFLIAGLFLLAGLSVYLYIPLAASRNPVINWDNASNLRNFIKLVFRYDYGGITNTPKNVPLQIRFIFVEKYFRTLFDILSYQVIFVLILGVFKASKINKRLSLSLIIGFLLTGAVSFFYAAGPIFSEYVWGVAERYYCQSIIVLMFFIPYGFVLIKEFLESKFSSLIYSYLILTYFAIVPVLLFKYNFPKTNLSKTKIGYNLAASILNPLPKNAILFVYGDNTSFDVWYVHYVLNLRPDVEIINPPNVGNNIYLNREINNYYSKNPKAELRSIISDTFEILKKDHRIFLTNPTISTPNGSILLPRGMVYEVIKKTDAPTEERFISEQEEIWKNIKIQSRSKLDMSEQNFVASEVPLFYSRALVNTGDYLIKHYKNYEEAELYYKKAIDADNDNPAGFAGLSASQYNNHDCKGAIKNISNAINLYPVWNGYYLQRYYYAKNCGLEKKQLEDIKYDYKKRFQIDIDRALIE